MPSGQNSLKISRFRSLERIIIRRHHSVPDRVDLSQILRQNLNIGGMANGAIAQCSVEPDITRHARGMHRLGIVVATPIAVAGLIMAGDAFLDRQADIAADEASLALAAESRPKPLPLLPPGFVIDAPVSPKPNALEQFDSRPWEKDPIISTQTGPWQKYRAVDHDPFAPSLKTKRPMQYFAMSLLVLGLAAACYVAVRSVGWVIDGFSRVSDGQK